MALTPTGQSSQTQQIPDWLKNLYLQLFASAQPYVFGTAPRPDLQGPGPQAPGTNKIPTDPSGQKWWGSWLGMDVGQVNDPANVPNRPPLWPAQPPREPQEYPTPNFGQNPMTPGNFPWPGGNVGTPGGIYPPPGGQSGGQTGGQPQQPNVVPQPVVPGHMGFPSNPQMPGGGQSGGQTGAPGGQPGGGGIAALIPQQPSGGIPAGISSRQWLDSLPANHGIPAELMSRIDQEGRFDGHSPFLVRELDPWTKNAHFQYQMPDGSIPPNANIWTKMADGQMQFTDQGAVVPTPQGYVPPTQQQLAQFGLKRGGRVKHRKTRSKRRMNDGGIVGGDWTPPDAVPEPNPGSGGDYGTPESAPPATATGANPSEIMGMSFGQYQPYPGQRFAEQGDLTRMYMAGTHRINEGLLDPYRDIKDPTDVANFSLDRMSELFTDPDMAIHSQIRDWGGPQVQQRYQATQYGPSGYSASDVQGAAGERLANYGGGDYMGVGVNSFIDPGVAGAYMDPYQRAVTDTQKELAQQQFNETRAGIGANAVQSGAFGGARHGLVEGVANRELSRQMNEIESRGLQDSYRNAQEQFERDRGANLQAQMANQGAFGQTQDRGLSALLQSGQLGLQAGLGAAGLNESSRQFGANLYDTGSQRQQGLDLETARQNEAIQRSIVDSNLNAMGLRGSASMDLLRGSDLYNDQMMDRLNQLRQAGAQGDAYEQQLMDFDYQQFLNQRDYPLQMANYYASLLGGYPATINTEQYTMGQQPSIYSGILGLASAGLGAYGASRGG